MGFRVWPGMVAVMVLAGCSVPLPALTPAPSQSSLPNPSSTPIQTVVAPVPTVPAPSPTVPAEPESTLTKAQKLVATMTPPQKAGQMILVEWTRKTGTTDELTGLVEKYSAGGVLYLGPGWNIARTKVVSDKVAAITVVDGVRPFVAADQEGGEVQRLNGTGVTKIASANKQGSWSVEKLQQSAGEWAQELTQAGINLNLAPVADTVAAKQAKKNQPIGALKRQFGSDPSLVGEHAAAFIAGMSSNQVLTTLKHFPGLGRISNNTDLSSKKIKDTVTTANDPYLEAFRLGIAAEPDMVMVSMAVYTQIDPKHQGVFSRIIIEELLRDDLGWQGVVIADSMSAEAVAKTPAGQRAVDFIDAGGDLMSFGTIADIKAAHKAILTKMKSSEDFAARVDQSVVRIILAKNRVGLVDL